MMDTKGVYFSPNTGEVGKQEFLYKKEDEGGLVSPELLTTFISRFSRGLVRAEPELAFPGMRSTFFDEKLQPIIWVDQDKVPREGVERSAFVIPVGLENIPLSGQSAGSIINSMVRDGTMLDAANFTYNNIAGQMRGSFNTHFNLPPNCVRSGLNYGIEYSNLNLSVKDQGDVIVVEVKNSENEVVQTVPLVDEKPHILSLIEGEDIVISACSMKIGDESRKSALIYRKKTSIEPQVSKPVEKPVVVQEVVSLREKLKTKLYDIVPKNHDCWHMSVIGESGEPTLVTVQTNGLDTGETLRLGRLADGKEDSADLLLSKKNTISRAHIRVQKSNAGNNKVTILDNYSTNGFSLINEDSFIFESKGGANIPDGSTLVFGAGSEKFFGVNVAGCLLIVPMPNDKSAWVNYRALEEDLLKITSDEVMKLVNHKEVIYRKRGEQCFVPHHIKGSVVSRTI